MALKSVESYVGTDLQVIKQAASKILIRANLDEEGKCQMCKN